ncbi:hypothetical protein SAMN05660964_03522 [Thiothrix caldifontis]|uniref:Uncharacterized protein n=1 Tax=Thiothrix caldifontis TaxID=525918 RepID=A0A1H4GKD7_9GAMM|nr:PIN domain-containing protein [Thiothrix caldifontis]SEB09450.1 hypothetical protein SAMN05660964_03522 [Thiothrix caldifontis]
MAYNAPQLMPLFRVQRPQVLNEISNVLRRKQKQAYTDILNVIHELQSNFQVSTVTTQTIEAVNVKVSSVACQGAA